MEGSESQLQSPAVDDTYVSSVKGWDYIFENDAKVKSQKMPKSQSFCPEERVFVGSRAKLHTAP